MWILKYFLKYKFLTLFAFVLILMIPYFYYEDTCIEVTPYEVPIKNLPYELIGLKIIHLSDVHLPCSSSYTDKIINLVKEQKPDLIFLTGDIVDRTADINNCGLDKFCRSLSDIAPTFAVSGNNDKSNSDKTLWKNIIEKNTVSVLDDTGILFTKGKSSLAILGVGDGSTFSKNNYSSLGNLKDIPILLLSHRPEKFYNYFHTKDCYTPDIVFCGHAHGGQFRIPFINQGLFAPGQGFFPKFTSGIYSSDNNGKMIVSRGLCNSGIPIRINNRPHLPVITLTKN